MATNWKSQQGDGMYSLQFETDDVDKYKLVEKASYDVCDAHGDVAVEQNLPDVEKECDYFKNKADFVEVVRCKDCEFYVPLGDDYEYKGKKAMHCILRASCTGDNYYCADGMRKEKG